MKTRVKDVEKGVLYQGINAIPQPNSKINGRGYQIVTLSQLMNVDGINQYGQKQTITTDQPFFFLRPEDRERIAKLVTPVLGVVTSRMNRIAGAGWVVTHDKKFEDKIYDNLRSLYQIFKEYEKAIDIKYIIARAKIRATLMTKMQDILPDLSNFEKCLLRWRKRISGEHTDKAESVQEWIEQPGQDNWSDFSKKWVYDLMIHGASAIYKEWQNGHLENIYILPGGSVIPFRSEYVTSQEVYFQIATGKQPLIYNSNEMSFSQYIPNSTRSYGLVPLEALINKITETLLFDQIMAEQADGSRLPEKMIIINDNSPFGGKDLELIEPLGEDEQQRIENKLNTRIQGGVMTFSGNNATVVDLSKENTMQIQNQRQKDIREDVAFIYNMSNMEVNLTGSDSVSGRSTADAQGDIEEGKGIIPIQALLEMKINRDILPYKFGSSFTFEFQGSDNEEKELNRQRLKLQTGLYSVNEIRSQDLNLEPFDDESLGKPPGTQMQPDGSDISPFNFKQM